MENLVKIWRYNRNDIGELFIVACGLLAFYFVLSVSLPRKKPRKIFRWFEYREFSDSRIDLLVKVGAFFMLVGFLEITAYLYYRKFFV